MNIQATKDNCDFEIFKEKPLKKGFCSFYEHC